MYHHYHDYSDEPVDAEALAFLDDFLADLPEDSPLAGALNKEPIPTLKQILFQQNQSTPHPHQQRWSSWVSYTLIDLEVIYLLNSFSSV